MASSANGKQHTLPAHPQHSMGSTGRLSKEEIEDHWATQTKNPARLWGSTKATRFGGIERVDSEPEMWSKGEFWNCDSNIRIWGEHEVRRNASGANHDVHRHDMITRLVLPPHPSLPNQKARQCTSGVVSPDCCFLEAWGFDLGQRDRQGNPIKKVWRAVNKGEQFRSLRTYDRDFGRMTDNFRTMRKSRSQPGSTMPVDPVVTLRPEDVGGEAGEIIETDPHHQPQHNGRTFGSRSCRGWDGHDHAARREGAKMAVTIHSQCFRSHPEGYPIKEHLELNPAAVYSKRYRLWGEENLRNHVEKGKSMTLTKSPKSSPKAK